jgi:hypothetical protein
VLRKETARILMIKIIREFSLKTFGIKFTKMRSAVFLLTDGQTQNEYFFMHATRFWPSLKFGIRNIGRESILWQWTIHVKDSEWNA